MKDLKQLMLFAKVVEFGGISSAARMLSLQKATLSRSLKRLEVAVGARLLERSSRQVRLTEMGSVLLRHCKRIAEELEEAEAAIGSMQAAVRGKLRIAAPHTFGRSMFSQVLFRFLDKYPETELEIELTNRRVDPVEEGFDFVIRLGPLADTSLVAKELGTAQSVLCASPAYLGANTPIRLPRDLENHRIIQSIFGSDRHHWTFSRGKAKVKIEVKPRLIANDPVVRRDAAVAGLGVALLPLWVVKEDFKTERLKRLLPSWKSSLTYHLYVLYPNRGSLALKSRAFLAFLDREIPTGLVD